MRLRDKIALVIGGGSGIGRAIAVRFAAEGAQVAVADLVPQAGQETVRLVAAGGGTASFFAVDVTRREQIRTVLEQVERQFDRLDILINSAGIPGRGRIEAVDDDLWDRAVAVNLSGVFWACKYAVPLLKRAGGGVILNLGSIAGLRGWPGSAIYSATKGGVVMLSRTLAADYARENIRVWAICPTAVDTPILHQFFAQESDPQTARQAYEANEPMGRMINVNEVANAAVYLASAEHPPYTPEPFIV
ncbi:MAG: SDR family oxidoreductase [Anaerolineae bacterium]|nr:SDR family oxidoreductase [Anaerolineae bacterium]